MDRRQSFKSIVLAAAGATALAIDTRSAATNRNAPNQATRVGGMRAPFIETDEDTWLFHEDWGRGKPVLFLHGAGSNSSQWQYNMVSLTEHGIRCIALDRRGHGRSSHPGWGYDYDTLARDLATVIQHLGLHGVTLVAHSMGAGEAVRYLTLYGPARIARLVLVAPILPFILKTPDNPDGIDRSVFDQLRANWGKDFPKWVADNARPFFTTETSDAMVQWGISLIMQSSLKANIECNRILTETDFRSELGKVRVPTIVIHGDKDVSAQIDFTGKRTARLIPGCELKVYEGAAHGLFITHSERFNNDLLQFIGNR